MESISNLESGIVAMSWMFDAIITLGATEDDELGSEAVWLELLIRFVVLILDLDLMSFDYTEVSWEVGGGCSRAVDCLEVQTPQKLSNQTRSPSFSSLERGGSSF